MSYVIVGLVSFFLGLFLGMWLVKHPEDAHEYEERAWDKIKRLVHLGTKNAIQSPSGMGPANESVRVLPPGGSSDPVPGGKEGNAN